METISVEPDDFCPFVFKSYYVVWKLGSATNETIIQYSLNRTM